MFPIPPPPEPQVIRPSPQVIQPKCISADTKFIRKPIPTLQIIAHMSSFWQKGQDEVFLRRECGLYLRRQMMDVHHHSLMTMAITKHIVQLGLCLRMVVEQHPRCALLPPEAAPVPNFFVDRQELGLGQASQATHEVLEFFRCKPFTSHCLEPWFSGQLTIQYPPHRSDITLATIRWTWHLTESPHE